MSLHKTDLHRPISKDFDGHHKPQNHLGTPRPLGNHTLSEQLRDLIRVT